MHFTHQASPDSQAFAFLRSPDLVLVHLLFFFLKLSTILSAIWPLAKDHASKPGNGYSNRGVNKRVGGRSETQKNGSKH